MPIGKLGGARAIGIDHHPLRTVGLCFTHELPVVQVGGYGIASPEDDVFAVRKGFRIESAGRPLRHQPRGRGAGTTERALTHRRTESIEKRIADIQPLHDALIAKIAVRHAGLRAVFSDDRRALIAANASSQLMRTNWRLPFGPLRFSG